MAKPKGRGRLEDRAGLIELDELVGLRVDREAQRVVGTVNDENGVLATRDGHQGVHGDVFGHGVHDTGMHPVPGDLRDLGPDLRVARSEGVHGDVLVHVPLRDEVEEVLHECGGDVVEHRRGTEHDPRKVRRMRRGDAQIRDARPLVGEVAGDVDAGEDADVEDARIVGVLDEAQVGELDQKGMDRDVLLGVATLGSDLLPLVEGHDDELVLGESDQAVDVDVRDVVLRDVVDHFRDLHFPTPCGVNVHTLLHRFLGQSPAFFQVNICFVKQNTRRAIYENLSKRSSENLYREEPVPRERGTGKMWQSTCYP